MISAVDTNILVDLLLPGTPHHDQSRELLAESRAWGDVVVCEAVYAEIAPAWAQPDEVDSFLAATGIRVERSSGEALHRAGLAWRAYSRQRPRLPSCSDCGESQAVACASCGAPLRFRQHTLADFLIGGHAVVHADRLLTRDRRSYGRYFPELKLA